MNASKWQREAFESSNVVKFEKKNSHVQSKQRCRASSPFNSLFVLPVVAVRAVRNAVLEKGYRAVALLTLPMSPSSLAALIVFCRMRLP